MSNVTNNCMMFNLQKIMRRRGREVRIKKEREKEGRKKNTKVHGGQIIPKVVQSIDKAGI